jgi:hypothetical protein
MPETPHVYSTDPSDKETTRVFKFLEKGRIREAGNIALVYRYKEITESEMFPYDLEIWTEIKQLSKENMAYMKVDKLPFCLFILSGPEGIIPVPLNDKDGPQENWIECPKRSADK